MSYEQFVETHGPQLYGSGVPQSLWKVVHEKASKEILDIGSNFQLAQISDEEEEEVSVPSYVLMSTAAVKKDDNIWFIDHAWTFRVREAMISLAQSPGLAERVHRMLGVAPDVAITDGRFVEALWKRLQTYRLASETTLDEENCWYLMDEVGCAISPVSQTQEPTVNMCPFYFSPTTTAFTLLWPAQDLEEGDFATAHFSKHLIAPSLLPGDPKRWIHDLLWGTEVEAAVEQEEESGKTLADAAEEQCIAAFTEYEQMMKSRLANVERVYGSPPGSPVKSFGPRLPQSKRKVWTDLDVVTKGLQSFMEQDDLYVLVTDPDDADIIWLSTFEEGLHQRLEAQCPRAAFVSQLPGEVLFCNKASMADTMQLALGLPSWLPVTYDATTQLYLFAGDFLRRERAELERNNAEPHHSYWIVKPPAMARSMDMFISKSLTQILRMSETGRKVICEYVADPCTFRGRKFDMRFILLVRSLHPTVEIYLYDTVWPRFALLPYSKEDFDIYEKHWTVMNYAKKEQMIDMRGAEFAVAFDQEHGEGKWAHVMDRTKQMLYEAFTAIARRVPQPTANGSGIHSVGMYGIDVLIDASYHPKLLEITFAPDCERALRHQPTFVRDVFATLFDGIPTRATRL